MSFIKSFWDNAKNFENEKPYFFLPLGILQVKNTVKIYLQGSIGSCNCNLQGLLMVMQKKQKDPSGFLQDYCKTLTKSLQDTFRIFSNAYKHKGGRLIEKFFSKLNWSYTLSWIILCYFLNIFNFFSSGGPGRAAL